MATKTMEMTAFEQKNLAVFERLQELTAAKKSLEEQEKKNQGRPDFCNGTKRNRIYRQRLRENLSYRRNGVGGTGHKGFPAGRSRSLQRSYE